jgi:hypothetical protein
LLVSEFEGRHEGVGHGRLLRRAQAVGGGGHLLLAERRAAPAAERGAQLIGDLRGRGARVHIAEQARKARVFIEDVTKLLAIWLIELMPPSCWYKLAVAGLVAAAGGGLDPPHPLEASARAKTPPIIVRVARLMVSPSFSFGWRQSAEIAAATHPSTIRAPRTLRSRYAAIVIVRARMSASYRHKPRS